MGQNERGSDVMQPQLSFDDLFNSVFDELPLKHDTLQAGDLVSVMNKKTLEHEFRVVVQTGNGLIQTIPRGASELTKPTVIQNLTALPAAAAFENELYAVVKTNAKNPRGEYVSAGLLPALSKHLARKSHATMDKELVNSARYWR